MKKSLGAKPYLIPMPVLMIATYNEDDTVDVMNMAWGGICDDEKVALNISPSHKTAANLMKRKAFTISVADAAHVEAADYLGIASGNKVADKFAKSGLHATKSAKVDAPVVEEFPITLECRVEELRYGDGILHVTGKILDVLADEKVLNGDGSVDPLKVDPIIFDTFQKNYFKLGEKAGKAWSSGTALLKK